MIKLAARLTAYGTTFYMLFAFVGWNWRWYNVIPQHDAETRLDLVFVFAFYVLIIEGVMCVRAGK